MTNLENMFRLFSIPEQTDSVFIFILSFKPLFCHKDYVVHSTIYFHVLIYTLISSTYHFLHILNILGHKKYVI